MLLRICSLGISAIRAKDAAAAAAAAEVGVELHADTTAHVSR